MTNTVPANFTGTIRDNAELTGPKGDSRIYVTVYEYENGECVDAYITATNR
jgi:hypothetical protein